MRIVYLHGFASSPQSSKAQFFGRKFAEYEIPFTAPALDGGDFEHLTITGQLSVVQETVAGADAPVVLMGSSLGGYVAAIYAARHPEQVERLVLLAPAFRFLERWTARFDEEALARWQQAGAIPFYHYGAKQEQMLGFEFIEDARIYDAEPAFPQPALILHGAKDDVVPSVGSQQFAQRQRAAGCQVEVKLFPSGHELTDVMEEMWEDTGAFLQFLHTRPPKS